MTETAFERFAADYKALGRSADDGSIDRLVASHFAFDIQLAPDIIRGAVRRAIREAQPACLLWEDLRAIQRDVETLPPFDRVPAPRPFATPRMVGAS
ncbi:MAG: hypothetical protein KatS3mg060_3741 [Dehalococcoidia bacterium]|nr:MAG: hypothetical protein KatS3mg060_3741 [Dehalococcoidia bacterium]